MLTAGNLARCLMNLEQGQARQRCMGPQSSLPTLAQTEVRIQQILTRFRAKHSADSPVLIRLERTLADFYTGLQKQALVTSGS